MYLNSQIMKFEKRINDMYNKMSKSAINCDRKTTKSTEQTEKAKIKAQEAAERKQKQTFRPSIASDKAAYRAKNVLPVPAPPYSRICLFIFSPSRISF